jgi:hypothetical protein
VSDPRIVLERRPVLKKIPTPTNTPKFVTAPSELTGLQRVEWLYTERRKQRDKALQQVEVSRLTDHLWLELVW